MMLEDYAKGLLLAWGIFAMLGWVLGTVVAYAGVQPVLAGAAATAAGYALFNAGIVYILTSGPGGGPPPGPQEAAPP